MDINHLRHLIVESLSMGELLAIESKLTAGRTEEIIREKLAYGDITRNKPMQINKIISFIDE